MNDFSRHITNLSPEKRALLQLQLMKRASVSDKQTIPRLPRSGEFYTFALSFAQQRLWFLDQLEPGSATYNVPGAIRMDGALDVQALRQALDIMVARHESLRTRFSSVNGLPVQIIVARESVFTPLVDLCVLPEVERENEVRRLIDSAAKLPFDLARGPLMRTTLLRLGEAQHILLLTLHHIITDGWSMGILLQEITALYEALSAGRSLSLPELPIQYADFAVWQGGWLQGEVLESLISYWKQQLNGIPAMLELPADRPRLAIQSDRGAHQSFVLSKGLSEQICALSRREGVTLFMILLAAFQTLLFRYTEQDDIVVGSPIANRGRTQTEQLIGFFVNTLVLRTDMSGNPTFRELLRRVREMALGAYAHQDVPFEKLIEDMQLERSLSHSPLFQVMFVLQNTPKRVLKESALTLSWLKSDSGTAKFDLYLAITECAEGLRGTLTYRTDLFDAATITRMMGHFRVLLEGIVAGPNRPMAMLPLLTEAERQQSVVEWNNTQAEFPDDQCVHQLFEAQAARTPEVIAVVHQGAQLSYAELNRRANQLAHRLQALGVGPEVPVGICIERSLEMIIGLLGILKAGGSYVPLDPAYPQERLAFMLSDADVAVLLTQRQRLDAFPECRAETVCLDTGWESIAHESGQNPISTATAANLAYVIYTSGSTGRAKGVLIDHKALVNYVEAVSLEYEVTAGDRVLQFASISFDAAAEEIFPCLTRGATLVLRTDSMLDSPSDFFRSCEHWGLTVLSLPTAYWHELAAGLAVDNLAIPASLRLVIIGGERALPERVATWQKYAGENTRLVNTYGPTEATVVATLCELAKPAGADDLLREVPIGRPLRNVQTYILDQYLQPVPVGVPGELHIGGAGLARGYLNCPELTAARFIRNPFSEDPQARLYKTGDRVRYLADGYIEYLGRIDQQVKIRGFRIEPGEIEAALTQHPWVRESAVLAREDIPGDKRLVAYVVVNVDTGETRGNLLAEGGAGEWHSFLKVKLPVYMVPSAFVILDALPLTPSGKLDRRALPAPDKTRPELEKAFVAPYTPIQEMLVGIWAEVLKLEKIGIHDNFFELGGHSLLATQVISRVRAAFQMELPLRCLFEAPTVAELAMVVIQKYVEDAESGEVSGLLAALERL